MPSASGSTRAASAKPAARAGAGSRGVVGELDRRLASVERELAGYEELVAERERLLAARAALLGEPVPGGQITQDDVAAYLEEHPGSAPREIARALGVSANRVSAHLFRGKTDRFVSRERGWWLR